MIKKSICLITGALVVFILGAAIMKPINVWYADAFLGGEDHIGHIFKFNVYVLWPLFIISGLILGRFINKKYLTKKSSGRKGPRR